MSATDPNSAPFDLQPSTDGCTSIYIGNLDANVNEELILSIFSRIGPIHRCKLVQEPGSGGEYFCFVEFSDHSIAERAISTMNGRKVYEKHIRVNWATNAGMRKDTSNDHHIFVGDLSYEIDSDTLRKAFEVYGEITDVRVVREFSGKSRGYGFISFRNKLDAENAIQFMHGKMLGGRAIRTNWASRKGPYTAKDSSKRPDFEEVSALATLFNCTIYVGGLSPGTTDYQLRPYFQQYGQITETRIFADKGYAFVKFSTHDQATHAICQMNGAIVEGNAIKCSWGKETPETQHAMLQVQQQQQPQYYPETQPAMLQQQQPQQYYPYYYQQYQQQFMPPGATQYAGYQYTIGYPNQPTTYMLQQQGQTGAIGGTTQPPEPPTYALQPSAAGYIPPQ